jgi:hypothetical protein
MQRLSMAEQLQPIAPEPKTLEESKYELQLNLEHLFNKNQTLKRIREAFLECKDFDFIGYLNEKLIEPNFGLDLLVQMSLHKRTSLPILTAILRPHFDDTQRTVDEIMKAGEAGLISWNAATQQLVVCADISPEIQAEIDAFQFPLPMVITPRPVMDNHDTGYITTRNSIILKKNHHDDDVCLDHINRMNKIKFAIDFDTANMIKNRWRNLDKPKLNEPESEFKKRVRAFEKYDRTSRQVISMLVQHGNELYLTHKYDKRGRVYCQGYHVNYQGAPWNKAVIELADKEIVP